jgi:hypothetical protein
LPFAVNYFLLFRYVSLCGFFGGKATPAQPSSLRTDKHALFLPFVGQEINAVGKNSAAKDKGSGTLCEKGESLSILRPVSSFLYSSSYASFFS